MNICMYIVNIYLETEFETLWLKERIEIILMLKRIHGVMV